MRHSSGCLNGNARPLSIAAIRISTNGRLFAISSVVVVVVTVVFIEKSFSPEISFYVKEEKINLTICGFVNG